MGRVEKGAEKGERRVGKRVRSVQGDGCACGGGEGDVTDGGVKAKAVEGKYSPDYHPCSALASRGREIIRGA